MSTIAALSTSAPSPIEIARQIEARVIGQEEAVREMAVALAKKLAGLRVGNILLVGSSGSGKTTLMRAVEEYLRSDPELVTSDRRWCASTPTCWARTPSSAAPARS